MTNSPVDDEESSSKKQWSFTPPMGTGALHRSSASTASYELKKALKRPYSCSSIPEKASPNPLFEGELNPEAPYSSTGRANWFTGEGTINGDFGYR